MKPIRTLLWCMLLHHQPGVCAPAEDEHISDGRVRRHLLGCPFTGGPWCHVVAGVGSQGLPVRALWMASMARTLWPRVLTR